MNVTRENIDALNAVVKVEIAKKDYSEKVEKILLDYRKTANIPGFRKGKVPMGMVKKQYGKAVLADEVNKLIQEALNKYLTEEKLDVLGQPLPKMQDQIDWNDDEFSFEFELGLAPDFEVNLKSEEPIIEYKIVADDKMIDEQVERIQKQYGKLVLQDAVAEDFEIYGTFTNEEEGIENKVSITLDKFKGDATKKQFIGAKVNDVVALKTKGLYQDDHELIHALKIDHDKADGLDIEVNFTINEINKRELAELDQELFDKLFGKDVVKSVSEMKTKIKEDAEKQFEQQADQKLFNDVTEYLVSNTKFDLPAEFLQKWIRHAGETELNEAQAKAEYEKSEKSLRFQLIEGKLMKDNELKVDFEDVKESARGSIRVQMAQFGNANPTDEEVEGIVARVLSNQDEVRKISEQLANAKMLSLFREKSNLQEKELTYNEFVKEVYKTEE